MKKSRVETAETRRTIVAAATELFVRDGVAGTGVNDVMGAAGLTAGGFYRHFDSKDALLGEAIESGFDALLDGIEAATVALAPLPALRAMVALYLRVDDAAFVACPLARLGTELKRADSSVRAITMGGHRRLVTMIAERLKRLGTRDPMAVSSSMVATMVGAVVLAQIAEDAAAASAILANAQRSLYAQLVSSKG